MNDESRRIDDAPTAFEVFARLYSAATPGVATAVIEASDTWGSVPRSLGGPTIWGRLPMRGSGRLAYALARAVRRERALIELRRRYGRDIDEIHRLRPSASPQGGPIRPLLRRTLRSGLLVELGRHDHERLIDRVVREAGAASNGPVALQPRADGAALAMLQLKDGARAVLRMMPVPGSSYPGTNADGLAALERGGVAQAPRLIARGVTLGAAWTTETRSPGLRPSRLHDTLIREITGFCAGLPQQPRPTGLSERMQALAHRYPRWATLIAQLAEAPVPAPGILQHGDLWRGNLLVNGGRLSGVIDWDTWHPAGVPGADLLQLIAMERRSQSRDDLGPLWTSGIWRSSDFLELSRPYWSAMGIEGTPQLLEAVGLDWWVSQVLRHQRLASNPAWVEENIDRVLQQLGGAR